MEMLGFHAWDYALSHKGELAIKAITAGSIYEEITVWNCCMEDRTNRIT